MKNIDLLTESYDYELPEEYIASRPSPGRDSSKLLVYKQSEDQIIHTSFKELHQYLDPENLLVLNDSKVFPCRLFGQKPSGGKVELFLLSLLEKQGLYHCMIRTSGKKNIGDKFEFGDLKAEIVTRGSEGDFWVRFNLTAASLLNFLEEQGQIPIPPYIRKGIADEQDLEDYQTVYAKETGSVAAPTAGLHFTPEVFKNLEDKGVDKAFVTLHVGAGTFKPVNAENIQDHKMHEEFFHVTQENLKKLNSKKNIIAVGTTSLRVLESTFNGEEFLGTPDGLSSTDIFLYPGVEVKSIKGLITNFHLPKSTLLMLVSALLGREKTLSLYEEAKKQNYRFFSYGDGMLILR